MLRPRYPLLGSVLCGVFVALTLIAVFGAAVFGCQAGDSPKTKASAATASAAPPPEPPLPPTPSRPVSFKSEDGASLAGELWMTTDKTAPAVILVHRLNASRAELKPLAERLAKSKQRFSVLAFDLRGHGESKAPKTAKPNDTNSLSKDVEAAIEKVLEVSEKQSKAIVLVGSSIGAALISEVAFAQPKVTALALISPGAAISGHDIYRPYAEVRNLPTFIAGAKDDTVSAPAVDSLEKMAITGTVKRYDGNRHSAGYLADEHPELYDDIEQWMMQIFGQEPIERRSLYYAPGKEQPKPKKPGKGG